MNESSERALTQAIATLAQADPLTKLLKEVRVGRMKATDPGLRAIIDAWLGTYHRVVDGLGDLDPVALRRLDPAPRLAVLVDAGIVTADQPAVVKLQSAYQSVLAKTTAAP